MNPKNPSKKLLAIIWITLVGLHFIILGSAYLNLKFFNTPIIALLAFVQMLLVILFFMEVRWGKKLTWLFVSAGFFWLLILFTLVASDYLMRNSH
jgi:caa(3)-type oxidase subunit IV